jgi:hypothetical protein
MMTVRSLLLAVGLLAASAMPALAHERGAIHLASRKVPVGGDIELTGERLPKNAVLKLQLRGALENYAIGDVRVSASGTFQSKLTLPPHVPAGSYTLVALAPDGDVAARAELVIAAAPAMRGMPAGAPMPHVPQQMSAPHATAEMMALNRKTSPGEWTVILGLIAVSLAAGVALLRKAAHMTAEERSTRRGAGPRVTARVG